MKRIILPLLLLPVTILAQSPQLEWKSKYGGSAFEILNFIEPVSDNGIILVSGSESLDGDVGSNQGSMDVWILKLSSSGAIQWSKSLGGSQHELASAVKETSDGGFIFIGSSRSSDGDLPQNRGESDVWAVKLDAAGNIVWQKTYGGSSIDNGYDIIELSGGGYLLAGSTASNNGDISSNKGYTDGLLMKLDSSGNVLWSRTLGGTLPDVFVKVLEVDGGYLASGSSESSDHDIVNSNGGNDCWVVKMDTAQNTVWSRKYGGSSVELLNDIVPVQDGSFVAAAVARSANGNVSVSKGGYDVWAFKLAPDGNLVWERSFGGSSDDWPNSIYRFNDGYLIASQTISTNGDVGGNSGDVDGWLINIDSTANLVWSKRIAGSGMDIASDVTVTNDGGIAVGGRTLSANGDFAGMIWHGQEDVWIIKYSTAVGVDHLTQPVPGLYPNPSAAAVTIDNLSVGAVLTVYNATGSMITSARADDTSVTIVIEDLPPGLYFVEVNNDGIRAFTKFVKL